VNRTWIYALNICIDFKQTSWNFEICIKLLHLVNKWKTIFMNIDELKWLYLNEHVAFIGYGYKKFKIKGHLKNKTHENQRAIQNQFRNFTNWWKITSLNFKTWVPHYCALLVTTKWWFSFSMWKWKFHLNDIPHK